MTPTIMVISVQEESLFMTELKNYYESFITSQKEASPHLLPLLNKYAITQFARPIPQHQRDALEKVIHFIYHKKAPLILDSCCGTGLSTITIAKSHPEALVIGIDKSKNRILRGATPPDNCLIIQADIYDMWTLFMQKNIRFIKHFMLYPNPWPKVSHLKRRFYAHPVFLAMCSLAPCFELRSNWPLFIEEAVLAFRFAGFKVNSHELIATAPPLSLFEKKYREHDVKLYVLTAQK